MVTGPFEVIPAPPLSPPPNGLEFSAVVIDHGENDYRWGNGVAFAPNACTLPTARKACDVTQPTKDTAKTRPAKSEYEPFIVDAYDTCGTFAFETAEYEARARQALSARETVTLEREFWTGTLHPENSHLAQTAGTNGPNVTTVGGARETLRRGLARLVQALADTGGGRGMVHARPSLVELWAGLQLLRWENGKLYTLTGNLVVPGYGYPGTGPRGEVVLAASEWAFVTDNVVVHRGPVEVFAPGVNGATVKRDTNEVTVRAERLVAALFNGCTLAAVNIDPTRTGS